MLTLRLLLLLLLIALPPAHGQDSRLSTELAGRVDAAVQKEMEKQSLVGVAVGILRDGEIVYLKGYGAANREKKLPVTTESVFNWASNSKPVCGVLAMQLVEKNQLDLDAEIHKYVPQFPAKEHPITMRQLLCHQSGIQHYGIVTPTKREYKSLQPHLDPVLALDVFNRTPLIYKPGEKTVYSSYAYILASAAVQGAGKEPFWTQVQKRISEPLGMKSLEYDMEDQGQPLWTVGYTKEAGNVVQAKSEAHYWKHGAGGFKSNIGDFAKWAQALLNHRLVSSDIEKQMWTRQKTSDGKPTGYGLGFAIDDQNDLKVSHSGKQDEATSRLVIYPDKRHGVVVMTNCGFGDPGAVSTAIYRALNQK